MGNMTTVPLAILFTVTLFDANFKRFSYISKIFRGPIPERLCLKNCALNERIVGPFMDYIITNQV